jgi:hypothetical protein
LSPRLVPYPLSEYGSDAYAGGLKQTRNPAGVTFLQSFAFWAHDHNAESTQLKAVRKTLMSRQKFAHSLRTARTKPFPGGKSHKDAGTTRGRTVSVSIGIQGPGLVNQGLRCPASVRPSYIGENCAPLVLRFGHLAGRLILVQLTAKQVRNFFGSRRGTSSSEASAGHPGETRGVLVTAVRISSDSGDFADIQYMNRYSRRIDRTTLTFDQNSALQVIEFTVSIPYGTEVLPWCLQLARPEKPIP